MRHHDYMQSDIKSELVIESIQLTAEVRVLIYIYGYVSSLWISYATPWHSNQAFGDEYR